MPSSRYALGEERRTREYSYKGNHRPSVVKATAPGELETACIFVFLHLVAYEG